MQGSAAHARFDREAGRKACSTRLLPTAQGTKPRDEEASSEGWRFGTGGWVSLVERAPTFENPLGAMEQGVRTADDTQASTCESRAARGAGRCTQ